MNKEQKMELLQKTCSQCRLCEHLAASRKNVVFGEGDINSDLVCVGEAPGQQENESGRPFVGASGQLMRKLMELGKWPEGSYYIANILKCRPPENRQPKPEEVANCIGYLKLQIETIKPKWIICWGATAGYYLLEPCRRLDQFKVGSLRKQVFDYNGAHAIITYHPAFAIRNGEEARKEIWSDIKFLRHLMASPENLAEQKAKQAKANEFSID